MQRTHELLVLLQDAGFEFVVVGCVAAIAHGATRSTKDLDVVAPFTTENLARLLKALAAHSPKHFTRPELGVVSQPATQARQAPLERRDASAHLARIRHGHLWLLADLVEQEVCER